MPEDPYADPATGVLCNKLGLSTSAELDAAERDITRAALMYYWDSPVSASPAANTAAPEMPGRTQRLQLVGIRSATSGWSLASAWSSVARRAE
jgi:hypothetical protein